MAFDLKLLVPGKGVHNLARTRLRFVAYVPQADPLQRVVCLHGGDIVTYDEYGRFFGPGRPSKMDLTTD